MTHRKLTDTLLTLAAAGGLMTATAIADEAVFQNGVNGYTGYRQAVLQGNFESRRTEDLSQREELKAVGVPWGGQQTMFLLRFDDILDPERGGIPANAKVRSARLELYRIGEAAASPAFDSVPPATRFIYVYPMLTPFYAEAEGEGGYSCFSYRRYGGSEEEYWGGEHRITEGPVKEIDYAKDPAGKIPIQPGSTEQWYQVDITETVQEAQKRGDKGSGHGFYVISPHYWFGLIFASGTVVDETLRPKLVIEYL